MLAGAALVGLFVLIFFVGRRSSSDVPPLAGPAVRATAQEPVASAPIVPPVVIPPVRSEPATETAPVPAAAKGPPGTLVVEATPWGKLFIDGKPRGDVEGSRRFSLPPGTYEVKLINRKAKIWTVAIESGKAHTVKWNFITE